MEYVHRRLLSIRLRLVEKCVYDVKNMLEANTNDRHFILYSINNNVNSELRMKIFMVSSLMLEQIHKMKEEFKLESQEVEASVKNNLLRNLNEVWAPLKDLVAGRMHGYDRLSDHDKQLLNPHFVKLYAMLEDIYSVMK